MQIYYLNSLKSKNKCENLKQSAISAPKSRTFFTVMIFTKLTVTDFIFVLISFSDVYINCTKNVTNSKI